MIGGIKFSDFDFTVSLKSFKKDYLKKITRERIKIRGHGSLRIRGRQHFTDEQIKDLISEKHYNKVIKNEDGEFEFTYNNPINGKKFLIVIVRANNDPQKSIRVVTTYTE